MIKRKKVIFALAIMFLLSMFTNVGTKEVIANLDLSTKLKERLIPIKTTIAENGFDDLQPLKEILRDKKVIGLGEATLGAKEFYEMKHRIVEFLVKEMDYRLFAIDAEFADVKIINDYIQNGNGSINDAIWALRQFNWSSAKVDKVNYINTTHAYLASWTTTEVSEMIEWMKDYNNNVEINEKVKFYGIDMELPEYSIDDLFEYLDIVNKEVGSKHRKRLSELVITHGFNLKYPEAKPLSLFTGMMEELKANFEENKEEYIGKTAANEYEIAKQDINIIFQWIEYHGKNLSFGTNEALEFRDYHMAENIKWILNFEKQFNNDKILILAHNRSISKINNSYISMGKHLENIYNGEYYSIGLEFYKGRFRAFGVDIWGVPISNYLAKFNLESSPKNTLAYKLEQTGIPISYIDFLTASKDEDIRKLLSNSEGMHNIGLMYPGKYAPAKFLSDLTKPYYYHNPIDAYDGLIFIKEISETTGVFDERDTKIEDGDKAIINHYLHILFGQLYTVVGIGIVIILVGFLIRKKIIAKKEGVGARYPSSSRWR